MTNTSRPYSATSAKTIPKSTESEKSELALHIARTLNEEHRLNYYLKVSRTYDEAIIRKALIEVAMIPQSKIKKSKAALFTYLLKKYEKKQK